MKKYKILGIIIIIFLLSGCSQLTREQSETIEPEKKTGFIVPTIGSYDSADTAIVVKKDRTKSTITLQNIDLGKHYTLEYHGLTSISDKYGEAISIDQLKIGQIVEVTFLKNKKTLTSAAISSRAWKFSEVIKYELGEKNKTLTIADQIYKLNDDVIIVSNDGIIDPLDLNSRDILTVYGIDHIIHSITVDKGHGYLRLVNDQDLIGGWIEVGTVIVPVTESMLLTVPEGKHQVLISNKGISGTKEIEIVRNQETELDISDFKIEQLKTGKIIFTVTPTNSVVYVDSQKVDITKEVTLSYGIHQINVRAKGYDSITQLVKVGQELGNISIELEKTKIEKSKTDKDKDKDKDSEKDKDKDDEDNEDVDENNDEDDSESNKNNNNNEIFTGTDQINNGDIIDNILGIGDFSVLINEPQDVEVYLDGNYLGITPTSFKKKQGIHEITLRKTGHQTRTYSIIVDGEEKDISFAFSPLEEIK